MTELRVHGVRLTAGPRELRIHSISLAVDTPPVQRELRIHSISLTSGPAPGIGDGGVWVQTGGQPVRHIPRVWNGSEYV